MNKPNRMDQVLPDLFVSDLITARSKLLYDKHNISYVLSVIDNPGGTLKLDKTKLSTVLPIEKLIQVRDIAEENLLRHLQEACDFIKEALESDNGAGLVHCQMGRSRSGAVVVGYKRIIDLVAVMREYDLTYEEALKRAREGRSCIWPNSGFVEQLNIWKACDFDILNKDGKEKLAYLQFKARLAEA